MRVSLSKQVTGGGVRKPRCLGASVCRTGMWIAAIWVAGVGSLYGQQLLDRVVASIGRQPIMLSDVTIATALGLVAVGGDNPVLSATQQLVDRQLMLIEVARFLPPEPDPSAVKTEMATLKTRAGAGLAALTESTGLDDARLERLARETLLIQAYLEQRFGAPLPASESEARQYYETHRAEFTREGVLRPFEEVETVAREFAAIDRRRATIAAWVASLRNRAEVTIRPVS
jgi:hypothetical protein